MPTNLENSAVATGLEKSVFIPIPKKGNAKGCSNYHTIALTSQARGHKESDTTEQLTHTSHVGKVMLKILQAGFSNM